MTPEQRRLARHALGLPNDYRRSYRNRYIIGSKGGGYTVWMRMVRDGNAVRERFGAHKENRFLFRLTPQAATSALENGETLDREDFPAMPAADGAKS